MIVIRLAIAHFDRCDDVRFDAAHQVKLQPHSPVFLLAVFDVEPAHELASAETGRVNREIRFN